MGSTVPISRRRLCTRKCRYRRWQQTVASSTEWNRLGRGDESSDGRVPIGEEVVVVVVVVVVVIRVVTLAAPSIDCKMVVEEVEVAGSVLGGVRVDAARDNDDELVRGAAVGDAM